MTQNTGGKYSIDEYITLLRLAGRSEETIKGYRNKLKAFAEFLKIPAEELHNNLTSSNLLKYATELTTNKVGKPKEEKRKRSDAGRKAVLTIIRRFYKVNKIELGELEFNAANPTIEPEQNDKPLTFETLRRMFDLTDTHGRAFLSFLISTGCRAGEACRVTLADLHGDYVDIPNAIAKRKQGGRVYLTAEAQEYVNQWLKERDAHINLADRRSVGLASIGAIRPKKDNRLFGMSYTSANRMFNRLYDKVDGARGKHHHRQCTIHSTRKFFRTYASRGMAVDLVTCLMRQRGYLDNIYWKKPEEEKRKEFRSGEAVLYVTRADHRVQSSKLDALERENEMLREELNQFKVSQTEQAQKERADILAMIREEIQREKKK